MKIYKIQDEYVKYLRTKEPKVLQNKEEKRPYIGTVLEITGYTYFIPLSSPKKKHKDMKNMKDFHKIEGGKYGVINFNKIIPVPKKCIIDFKFEDEEDIEYDVALGCNEDDYVLASNGNIKIKKSLVDESFRKIGKELLIWFVDEDDPLHTYRVVEVTDDKVIAEFID